MTLCENGNAHKTYPVRLGIGGIGKTREGDQKTPLGTYVLSAPRASAKYGLFIQIGYPTEAQRKHGFTGSSIGVHGPGREFTWLGRAINLFDTTNGCVGIATDAEMQAIAQWVREHAVARIALD